MEKKSLSKDETLTGITNDLKTILQGITTQQESVHQLAIRAVSFTWKYEDTSATKAALNGLASAKGSFRCESLAYWFNHVAGIACIFDSTSDQYKCSFKKGKSSKSDLGIVFTYDKIHMAACKKATNRFWLVAPVKIKELKLQTELSKITHNAELNMAKGLLAGELSVEEVKEYLTNSLKRIEQLEKDDKVKAWVDEYLSKQVSVVANVTLNNETINKDIEVVGRDSQIDYKELEELLAEV